jgi:hypothetical protein
MARDIIGRFFGWVDKKLGTELPLREEHVDTPATFRTVRGDGTDPKAAVARPDINSAALAGKQLDAPDETSALRGLFDDLNRRGR